MRWLLILLAAPAWAQGCPDAPDLSERIDPLYAALASATTEGEGRAIMNEMWQIWDDAPDATAQEILDEGMMARAEFDLLRARDRFDALIGYCPDYAEGYNQRAFVHVLLGDNAAALPDLERAVALNPRHLGALSGQALTLIALGREAEGQEVLRRATALHPYLPERRFLKDIPGKDL